MIEHMEAQASLKLATLKGNRVKAYIDSTHKGNIVQVYARRFSNDRQVFGYSYGGTRLERSVLLQLLCPEMECSLCKITNNKWQALQGAAIAKVRQPLQSYQFAHLMEEITIATREQTYIARPATFKCLTACPMKAHKPIVISRTGWDVFNRGKYVAGGLVANPETLALEPMFPTTEQAHAWISSLSHAHLE